MTERPPYFCYVRNWLGELVPQRWSEVPYRPVVQRNSDEKLIYPESWLLLKPEHMGLSLKELSLLFPPPSQEPAS